MSISFENSNTKINLMKAFAGESQARNRYTFAASQAKKEGFSAIEKIFIFTANQEKEHAEIFYKLLSPFCGESITIQSDFPINTYKSTLDLLKAAAEGEYEEYGKLYKSFGDEAKTEGFEEIAKKFYNIAEIEKLHGDRFSKVADLIEKNQLFSSEKETRWFCLNCGEVYIGKSAPKECPVCSHPQGYFINQDWIML